MLHKPDLFIQNFTRIILQKLLNGYLKLKIITHLKKVCEVSHHLQKLFTNSKQTSTHKKIHKPFHELKILHNFQTFYTNLVRAVHRFLQLWSRFIPRNKHIILANFTFSFKDFRISFNFSIRLISVLEAGIFFNTKNGLQISIDG